MDEALISAVKEKKVLSGLPNSLVWRFLEKNDLDIKATRAELRKFFGVFLTNKVLKGAGSEVLESHISSKGRDYNEFYGKVFGGLSGMGSVVDLGCGANGFSYGEVQGVLGDVDYIGIEATGQLVEAMNKYFENQEFVGAKVIWGDIFEFEEILDVVSGAKEPRVVMMLQVIDAMEAIKKDSSKEFLLGLRDVLNKGDTVVISMPMKSISGRKRFEASRKWLRDFLDMEFELVDEFIVGDERVFRVRKN